MKVIYTRSLADLLALEVLSAQVVGGFLDLFFSHWHGPFGSFPLKRGLG
jgi:hypothetical protein